MNILFEEDGAFRAGSVLADNTTSLQVELASGKRAKVKAANVLQRFATPAPGELLERAEAEAEGIDIDFLWEVCGDAEFASRNWPPSTTAPNPMRCKQPPCCCACTRRRCTSIARAAAASARRRRRSCRRRWPAWRKSASRRWPSSAWSSELKAGQLPAEFGPILPQLIYKPDRNRGETKALEAACGETGKSVARLLFDCGALASTHDYHLGRFLFEYFPEGKGGTGFRCFRTPRWSRPICRSPQVQAFSVDDAHTTEIDDAFSVTAKPEGGWRIGIHIAAPGLGFAPDSDLGRIARERLSTVYMPGRKITMLPEAVVEHFTLAAGQDVPAISLYLDVAADYRLLGHETRIERVPVAANLRHHDIEPVFNAATLASGLGDFAWRDELKRLWEFAQVLEAGRGKPSDNGNRKDYNFIVDWTVDSGIAAEPGMGHVVIEERPRGSPLDTLVAELMILANATWGAMLRDAGIPALYRVQTAGKVRMSTVAAAHEGSASIATPGRPRPCGATATCSTSGSCWPCCARKSRSFRQGRRTCWRRCVTSN
jgi:exoribonuclease-2